MVLITDSSWSLMTFRTELIKSLANHFNISICTVYAEHRSTAPKGCVSLVSVGARKSRTSILFSIMGFIFKCPCEIKNTDLLVTFTAPGHLLGALLYLRYRIPFFPTIAGLGDAFDSSVKGLGYLMMNYVYRLVCKTATEVFFQNPDDRRAFRNLGMIGAHDGVLVPGSGVDFLGAPRKIDGQVISRDRPLRYCMMARIIKPKGIFDYLSVARHFEDSELVAFDFFGRPDPFHPQAIDAETFALECERSNVVYKGESTNPLWDMHTYDVLILPSLYKEGLPYSLIQALATRVVIIAYDVSGVRDVISQTGGFLTTDCTPTSICKILDWMLIAGRPELNKISGEAYHRGQHLFDIKMVSNRYIRAFEGT